MKINVQKLFSLDGHKDCVYTLEKGEDANIFYSAGGDGMVVEWDLKKPELGKLIAKMKNSVYSLHYLANRKVLIAAQNFEGIHLLDPVTKDEVATLKISNSQIFDMKHFEGKLFIGSGDGTLYIVDLETMAFVKKIKLADKSIRTIALNPQLGDIAVGLSDNSIRILDLTTFHQKYSIHAHKLSVFAMVYDFAGNRLLSVSRDAHIKSWDALDHYKMNQSVVAHMYAINSLSISPDHQHFVTGSMDKSIKVWELESMKLLKVIDKSRHAGHATSVNKVLWTNFNNQVVSASDDKKISIWDLSIN